MKSFAVVAAMAAMSNAALDFNNLPDIDLDQFVEQWFDPHSSHDRLREPPRQVLWASSNQGSIKNKNVKANLDTIPEGTELNDTIGDVNDSILAHEQEEDVDETRVPPFTPP